MRKYLLLAGIMGVAGMAIATTSKTPHKVRCPLSTVYDLRDQGHVFVNFDNGLEREQNPEQELAKSGQAKSLKEAFSRARTEGEIYCITKGRFAAQNRAGIHFHDPDSRLNKMGVVFVDFENWSDAETVFEGFAKSSNRSLFIDRWIPSFGLRPRTKLIFKAKDLFFEGPSGQLMGVSAVPEKLAILK